MKEIIGNQAFSTMQNLAKYCGFKQLLDKQKRFFENKISEYEGVLPLTCHIPQINVNIFITTKYWLPINGIIGYEVASRYEGIVLPQDTKDITGQILDAPHNKISIAIKENEWAKLANCSSFSEIKAYINALIPHIEKQRQIEDSKALNEQHLLDYLKNNPPLSNKFDNILEEHLAYIKQVRPDIVESWKYYAEFKQNCARFHSSKVLRDDKMADSTTKQS